MKEFKIQCPDILIKNNQFNQETVDMMLYFYKAGVQEGRELEKAKQKESNYIVADKQENILSSLADIASNLDHNPPIQTAKPTETRKSESNENKKCIDMALLTMFNNCIEEITSGQYADIDTTLVCETYGVEKKSRLINLYTFFVAGINSGIELPDLLDSKQERLQVNG